MNSENVKSCMEKISGEVTPAQAEEIGKGLAVLPDEKAEKVKNTGTKSLKCTTVLSAVFGLFGGGDFYLGFIGRAICKCIFNVVLPLALLISAFVGIVPVNRKNFEYGSNYLRFSEQKTDELADYATIHPIADKNYELSDGGFTANIAAVSDLYDAVNVRLSEELNKIPENLSEGLEPVAGDITKDTLREKYTAINAAFASFRENPEEEEVLETYADYPYMTFDEYVEAVGKLVDDIDNIFPDPEQPEEGEPVKPLAEQLIENLGAAAGDDAVKDDKQLTDDLSALSAKIGTLSDKSALSKEKIKKFLSLDFNDITDIGMLDTYEEGLDALAESIVDFKTTFDTSLDFAQIKQLYMSAYDAGQSIREFFTDLYRRYEMMTEIGGISFYAAADAKNDIVNLVPAGEGEERDDRDFITLLGEVKTSLEPIAATAEDDSVVKKAYEGLVTLEGNYGSVTLADDLAAVYGKRTAIEGEEGDSEGKITVNRLDGFESALKSFIAANTALQDETEDDTKSYANFSALEAMYRQMDSSFAAIEGNLAVLDTLCGYLANGIHFICDYKASTLLNFYSDVDYDGYHYNEEEKSIILITMLADKPDIGAEKELNIYGMLADYYSRSRDIGNIYYTDGGIANMAQAGKIKENLNIMKDEINSLNELTLSKIQGWEYNAELTQMMIGIYVGIDAIIVIAYWIFEVFRNRQKCCKANYEAYKTAIQG